MLAVTNNTFKNNQAVGMHIYVAPREKSMKLFSVAERLRNYLTKPLPLLGGNATGVLMHVDMWLNDEPDGDLTISDFYDIAKYDADAVVPFGGFGINELIAEQLTKIIYKE
jgi:hypothetical protein